MQIIFTDLNDGLTYLDFYFLPCFFSMIPILLFLFKKIGFFGFCFCLF